MECIKGFDENVSMQFVHSLANGKMIYNGIYFEIIEDLIETMSSLSLKGKSWCKKPRVLDEAKLQKIIYSKEEPMCIHGSYSREDLPKIWHAQGSFIDALLLPISHFQPLQKP